MGTFKRTELCLALTSGKESGWLSGGDEGGRPSRLLLSNGEATSPGVCAGVGFFGEGLRLLSELGVAGVRLSMISINKTFETCLKTAAWIK